MGARLKSAGTSFCVPIRQPQLGRGLCIVTHRQGVPAGPARRTIPLRIARGRREGCWRSFSLLRRRSRGRCAGEIDQCVDDPASSGSSSRSRRTSVDLDAVDGNCFKCDSEEKPCEIVELMRRRRAQQLSARSTFRAAPQEHRLGSLDLKRNWAAPCLCGASSLSANRRAGLAAAAFIPNGRAPALSPIEPVGDHRGPIIASLSSAPARAPRTLAASPGIAAREDGSSAAGPRNPATTPV